MKQVLFLMINLYNSIMQSNQSIRDLSIINCYFYSEE